MASWVADSRSPTDGAASSSLLTLGDLTGDFRDDLIAIDGAGVMTLHPGVGGGGLGAARVIAGSWSGLTAVLAVGDFNGDRSVTT